MIYAGNTIVPIEGFRDVVIMVQTPQGPAKIMLLDVALVPSFHTSITVYDKFHSKGVYWDSEKGRLTQEGQIFCTIERHHRQWTLEFVKLTKGEEDAVFSTQSAQPKQEEASPDI